MIFLEDFSNVELVKAGTFDASTGKASITRAMLEEIVENYSQLKDEFHAPLKLGHDVADNLLPKGLPAAGWIENLSLTNDDVLVGDFLQVPEEIAELIHTGAYRHRSVEIQPGFEANDTEYGHVLTGVALLGQEIPAVKGLADIVELYGDEKIAAAHTHSKEAIVLKLEIDATELDPMKVLEALVAEGDEQSRWLLDELRALLSRVRAIRNMDLESGMNRKELLEALGLPVDASTDAIANAVGNLPPEAGAPDPGPDPEPAPEPEPEPAPAAGETELTALRKENVLLTARLDKFDDDKDKELCAGLVAGAVTDGKLLARSSERFLALGAKVGPTELKAVIDDMPKVIEFGERGTSGSNGEADQFDLSVGESKIAAQMGGPEVAAKIKAGKKLAAGIPLNTES